MRRAIVLTACAVVTAALALPAQAGPSTTRGSTGRTSEYVVLYKDGVSLAQAHAAVQAAGGTIVKENKAVGVATVRSADPDFMGDARRRSAVDGAAPDRAIGEAPTAAGTAAAKSTAVEHEGRDGGPRQAARRSTGDPLAGHQWDMKRIHATADGSYRVESGDRRVLVGVIDTGIDGNHPDIKANFDRGLSRNFTKDVPVDAIGTVLDGPCEHPSCVDPVDEDDNEHGTHVASTIASPLNGLGMAGVAPNVTLVSVRAGQDSGFFFLQPVVDALTYSADAGIDVVNMSFYTDPWLFDCPDNPADSAEYQAEQRTVIRASERALAYAHRHGVSLVSAAGNGATDYTKTIIDASSPDYPAKPGAAPYTRMIPPSCVSEPSEGQNVISVSSVGISDRKAYYSDYGYHYVDVSAPGGDTYDTADGKSDVTKGILAAYPEALAKARGELNADGTPKVPYVVRDCKGATCGYYQYLQGTSMATPHVTGVVALIISRYGQRDPVHGGLTLPPVRVQSILQGTASDHACPTPRAYTYTREVRQADGTYKKVTDTHTCEGAAGDNGFYGQGIVDALHAVTR